MQDLRSVQLKGKKVLLRLDLNMPIVDGKILDEERLLRALPTITHLKQQGAITLILSHLGRPKGVDVALSLKQIASSIEAHVGPIHFVDDCCGPLPALQEGDIALLENLRFHKEEEANDPGFAERLAEHADIFVNDAFAVSHRAHASVEAITRFLPSYPGFLMGEEIQALTKGLENPEKPVMAIVAGSKVSTKLELLENLLDKVQVLVLGGGIANTFLKAQGHDMGASLVEKDMLGTATKVMEKAAEKNVEILLPIDGRIDGGHVVPVGSIHGDQKMLDIGDASAAAIAEKIKTMRTVVWNGPLGVFEVPPLHEGSLKVAQALAEIPGIFSLAGGGETVALLKQAGVAEQFSYISTAGGAFREWLEGKTLPGVAALMETEDHA